MPTYTREEIIQELGIAQLSPNEQDDIIAEVGQNVFSHILLAILDHLPEEHREHFKELTLAHRGEEAEMLAATHIPEFSSFVIVERQKALDEYKRLAAA